MLPPHCLFMAGAGSGAAANGRGQWVQFPPLAQSKRDRLSGLAARSSLNLSIINNDNPRH
ncbi:hypothetical protein [Spirulina sp. 06S082]|uniref:hypothetical protein n=1 Tax=Spirulina sp. 06S082 TaxID=3110248 RepID=UPI002B1F8F52|nr:hypothetical protein [Spirulina sp. 06S082]MEA5469337.1 hypothetical protein [Spirulina sp. 06S082]